MKFYSFGNHTKPVFFMLPGTCCYWKCNSDILIPLLTKDFYLVFVSYDGFDESENTIFPDMITETKKIEDYIIHTFNGHIHAAYGCSLGGSFVGLLIQRGKIQIEHGIIGSSDLDQGSGILAKAQGRIMTQVLYPIVHTGKIPAWLQKRFTKSADADYYRNAIKLLGIGTYDLSFIRKRSIFRQYYSDLCTPLDLQISAPDTTIHCFYAVKMGPKYEKRYQEHFKKPDIRRYDLNHEELLISYPQKWAEEIRKCCFDNSQKKRG